MNPQELSKLYYSACENAHKEIDQLYESCHESNGDPISDTEKIIHTLQRVNQKVRIELDLIKSAVIEHHETNGR
jgi:hypothetical protein